MGKKKKSSLAGRAGYRTRKHPVTGEVEQVPGTRAGRKRTRLSFGHPLRTHDLNFRPASTRKERATESGKAKK